MSVQKAKVICMILVNFSKFNTLPTKELFSKSYKKLVYDVAEIIKTHSLSFVSYGVFPIIAIISQVLVALICSLDFFLHQITKCVVGSSVGFLYLILHFNKSLTRSFANLIHLQSSFFYFIGMNVKHLNSFSLLSKLSFIHSTFSASSVPQFQHNSSF